MATGDGPVLQPDAAVVEGYSNPAWLAVLIAGRRLGLFDRGAWFGVPDYVAYPKAVALLCCAGVFAACYGAARSVSRRPALVTVLAGTVTAAVPSFVIWSFSGLENSFLALTVVPLGLAVAAFGLLSPDWMGEYRFATPVWPLAAFAAVLAGVHLLSQLAIRGRASLVALSVVGVMISASSWFDAAAAFRDHPTAPLCSSRRTPVMSSTRTPACSRCGTAHY